MSFQHPSFLWALLLLAIPIIIHLFNFRRYKKVIFSNVEMLKDIQTESKKSRQLKRYLILFSRLFALACLVLAFAMPYIPAKNTATTGRNLVAIYLDNSNSMNGEGEGGQSFEYAKNLARNVVQNLPEEAEIQIIDNQRSAFSTKIQTKTDAIKLIDDCEITNHVNSVSLPVNSFFQVSKSNGFSSGQLFMISDFQEQKEGDVLSDSVCHFVLIPLEHQNALNVSIDSVWLQEPISKPGEQIELSIKLTNNGDEEVPSTTIELTVNNVQQGVETFGLKARETRTLKMAFFTKVEGWSTGQLSINDVPITFDNRYFFALKQKDFVNVLTIGQQSEAISRVFSNDSNFNYNYSNGTNIDYTSLAKYDLIILNQMDEVSSGLSEQMAVHVGNGSSLCIIPPPNQFNYNTLALEMALPLFGGVNIKNQSISAKSLNHPFLKPVYKSIPSNAEMPRVEKHYELKGGSPILTIKDGSAILTQNSVKNGKIFTWATPLTNWSTLAKHELFVSCFLQMAFSKNIRPQLAYTISSNDPISFASNQNEEVSLQLSKEGRSTLVESSISAGSIRCWLNDDIDNEGIYTLETKDNIEIGKLALNVNRKESHQRYYDQTDLKDRFSSTSFEIIEDSEAAIQQSVSQSSSGKSLWKLFIVLSLLFLLIEILLLRFLKT